MASKSKLEEIRLREEALKEMDKELDQRRQKTKELIPQAETLHKTSQAAKSSLPESSEKDRIDSLMKAIQDPSLALGQYDDDEDLLNSQSEKNQKKMKEAMESDEEVNRHEMENSNDDYEEEKEEDHNEIIEEASEEEEKGEDIQFKTRQSPIDSNTRPKSGIKEVRETFSKERENARNIFEKEMEKATAKENIQRIREYGDLLAENEKQELKIIEQEQMIGTLKNKLEMVEDRLTTRENQLLELESKGKNLSEDSKKYLNQINGLTDKLESARKTASEAQDKLKKAEKELERLQQENESLVKAANKVEKEFSKKDSRINKLQEEIDKMKLNVRTNKQTSKEVDNAVEKAQERLIQENKKLERQRNELLQAFKKQMKLVDVLKRQKTHLEAARLLQFTEEEFVGAIELGNKLI